MRLRQGLSLLAAVSVLAFAGPVRADVKAGVDAWTAGDYPTAVKEWQEPAARGDADAQFNLAQAYRLGRGVPQNDAKALELYAAAAKSGHVEAADHYGLMLFQAGRRDEALPYVQAAAGRGDPRAQYLLGIAYFNGDLFEKDWVRAYALMTLANSAGLPQAVPAMAQMDQFIPAEQRQQAAGLATTLKKEAEVARASQLAAVDPAATSLPPASVAATAKVPRPVEKVPTEPSSAAMSDGAAKARIAVAEAASATGAESPATAGADYARPATAEPAPAPSSPPRVPSKPAAVAAKSPEPAPAASPEAPAPPKPAAAAAATPKPAPPGAQTKPAAAKPVAPKPAAPVTRTATGPWRLQLGSFAVTGNAEKMWAQISGRPELSGKTRAITTSGRFTMLTAGGFASQADANAACAALKRGGHSCIVTR